MEVGAKIISVDPGSPASRTSIAPGDTLESVNGHVIRDVLDYKYYAYDTRLRLVLTGADGRLRLVRLKKREGEDLGLNFETYLMDRARSCANKCIFCFVDQLPPGMRSTLYFKDDDARLSFLQGNYITLTNLSEREAQRIIDLRVSPINVSVHTTDPELRCRQRYVDLIVNPQVKETFIKRAQIVATMREYFNEAGCLEVETPILQSIPGGATARPFITHHNALDIPLYLRIANELYLKRLIVGGYSGVYEFAKDFRNEGMDKTHNPEFTCMEIYVAYKDYIWMMEFVEKMLEKISLRVNGTTEVQIGEHKVDFKPPYRRLPILDAIKEYAGVDVSGMEEDELRATCKKLNVEVEPSMGKGKLIDAIFGEYAEKNLIEPTYIIDYPVEMSPLTKRHRSNPALTERFELFVCGKELANAYSELNDPIDQLERFEEQARLKSKGDDEAMFIDYDFVRALEYGMPPTSGLGMGIDRLTMFMTGQSTIQDVLFFPQMKPEKAVKKEEEKEQ